MFIFPFFIPYKQEKITIVTIEKHHFVDENGHKKIRWGNDENALVTYEYADEWSNMIIENFKRQLLTPPSPEDKEIK